jgi:hypothetical protein
LPWQQTIKKSKGRPNDGVRIIYLFIIYPFLFFSQTNNKKEEDVYLKW